MDSRRQIAEHFLKLCSTGDSREAFELYAGTDFIHHNPYFKGDAEALMIGMEQAANPQRTFQILRVLEDGEFAAVHSFIKQSSSDLGAVTMHIFKFSDDKISELWDFGQLVPENMVNENGMF